MQILTCAEWIIIIVLSIIGAVITTYFSQKRRRKADLARSPIYIETKLNIIRVQASHELTPALRDNPAMEQFLAYKLSQEILKQKLIRFDYVERGNGLSEPPPIIGHATINVIDGYAAINVIDANKYPS